MVEEAPKVCTRSSAFIYNYTHKYKHSMISTKYIFIMLSNTMVQWYNISWFHNKVCGFHSLIASNLYKRNIDASSYSCLTKWGPTIHIHSQNLDKKRPSWLSPLTQFSSPQHGCPTLGYSLYHPLISALIFVVHLKKNSSIKTLQQCFQCCTKKNGLNWSFQKNQVPQSNHPSSDHGNGQEWPCLPKVSASSNFKSFEARDQDGALPSNVPTESFNAASLSLGAGVNWGYLACCRATFFEGLRFFGREVGDIISLYILFKKKKKF